MNILIIDTPEGEITILQPELIFEQAASDINNLNEQQIGEIHT